MKAKRRISDNEVILIVNEYLDTDMGTKQIARKHKMSMSGLQELLRRLKVPRRRRTKDQWDDLAKRVKDSRLEEKL